jgi:hypothetical protein
MPGEIATAHNFPRDILRSILGPVFGGVECDDPNRVAYWPDIRSLIVVSRSASPRSVSANAAPDCP